MPQKILLLTKNYPPQIGGIEKYVHDLYNKLVLEGNEVKLIVASPRNEYLLANSLKSFFWNFFYIVFELYRLFSFACRALFLGFYYARKSDLIWSMDGSISIIGVFLGKIFGRKTRVTIHGTDIVWNKVLYQKIIPKFVAYNNEIYAVSENTLQECLKRSIPIEKITLAVHSIETIFLPQVQKFDKHVFLANMGILNPEKIVLFSMGRWIERKGFHWFLENVLPLLNPEKFHYILAGFGPYEDVYKAIIDSRRMSNVTLLGKVDDFLQKSMLYSSADFFIMPNLLREGDIEGFPLVFLEAKFYGLKTLIGYVQGIGVNEHDGAYFCGNDIAKWVSAITKVT